MIPEPHPYDPDDPTSEGLDEDLGYLVPGTQRGDLIDPLDPVEY